MNNLMKILLLSGVSIMLVFHNPCLSKGLIPPVQPEHITVIDFSCDTDDLPAVFDWRENGGVTPARDQGFVDCYPCWAFCLIAAVECSAVIQTGQILDLSEQQLLDCNQEDYGCDGGWLDGWTILRDYGAVTESCYPYAGEDLPCAQNICNPVIQVTDCTIVGDNELAIKQALYDHAPVACGMTVYSDFSFYNEGCYSHEGNDMYNHGVVIVGWDDTACDGNGAWIVKNSFGNNWGENGYIYMEYGTCRIGTGARYFDVTNAPTPTPTVIPTPTPETMIYSLAMIDTEMSPGDTFHLQRQFYHPGPHPLISDESIMLIIGSDVFFLETRFTTEFVPDVIHPWTIYRFVWPNVPSAQLDLIIAGCLQDPDTLDVLIYDLIDWTY